MATTFHSTSRRALLGAFALAPVAALAVHPIAASTTPSTEAWNRLHSAFLAADKAWDDHIELVQGPAEDELARRAPVPARQFEVRALNGQVRSFAFKPSQPNHYDDYELPFRTHGDRLKAEWAAHEATYPKVRAELRLDEIEAQGDRLDQVRRSALTSIMKTGAPNLAAVQFKLEQAEIMDDRAMALAISVIIEDVGRLNKSSTH